MKSELKIIMSYEQYDNLRMTIAGLQGALTASRDFYAEHKYEGTAKLCDEWLQKAEDILKSTSPMNVDRGRIIICKAH